MTTVTILHVNMIMYFTILATPAAIGCYDIDDCCINDLLVFTVAMLTGEKVNC